VVGWDWADAHHEVVGEDRPGHRVGAGAVDHTREALERLEGQLVRWARGVRADVRVVSETSQALVVDGWSTTGFTVYPVNPKVADARRQPSGAKTDRLDAAILARLGGQEADTLRALANRWLRIGFRLWQDQAPDAEAKFLAAPARPRAA
jgi:hypothetical protein